MEFHNVTHRDSTSCSGDTDRIGIAVGGVPHLRPDISDPTVSILSRNRAEAVTTYEPAIFPSCEKAFIRASATARLEGGRAKVLLTHAYITTNPAYDWAIKKLLGSQQSTRNLTGNGQSKHTVKCILQLCSLCR